MSLYASHYPFTEVIRKLFFSYIRLYFRPHVKGAEHIPLEGAFILAANHASHVDTAVIFSTLPPSLRQRTVAAAARDYFFEGGWQQSTARILFNAIPVDRDTVKGEDPLRHVIRALDEGYGVVIYPEGTRSMTGQIGPFRRGIGRLIAAFPDVPVIPLRVSGTARAMPKGAAAPRPLTVHVRFGPPLHLQADLNDRASWQTAADAVREAVLQLEAR
ncbi:MAG: 1-acyl-sn-glycerol-3-phosphate acyltransferase [Chloroflexota bacterium]|nr:MAG: 1-acyl-sn-glycerol-3-phosphate acyltransferase [Chloroflexota bacterium]